MASCAADSEKAHFVRKRIFGGPIWVVMLGLEGTGHHGLCESLAPKCDGEFFSAGMHSEQRAGQPCIALDGEMQQVVRQLIFATPRTWRRRRRALHQRLRMYRNLSDGYRMIFQCTSCRDSLYPQFMMSYPDAELAMQHAAPEEGKVTAHADAAVFARHAEEVGVDVRFIVLRRDPAAAIASVTRRTMVPFHAAARILRDNDAQLASQIRRMSAAFVYELHYETVHADVARLASFLKMNATALEESLRNNFRSTSHQLAREQRAYVRYLWQM